ncbi:voltage-dependent anion-selective channel protein 3 isoform X2 [Pygocentrus nattereri]|uniref:voltage-dependent anion-selective channel protein 3 isoform X2 n=2 Tax=Pygocentrus nattereri TaxID=42514 RepID=UPI000814ABA2|nr:voltage-dependent anion-selective channel protein 3 isoform X2 [Pygocentrus nattereri]
MRAARPGLSACFSFSVSSSLRAGVQPGSSEPSKRTIPEKRAKQGLKMDREEDKKKGKETEIQMKESKPCSHCKTKKCGSMAVPPAYSDLGKSAKDIFSKGYAFGTVKLDLKTKSQSGVEFSTGGSSNTDTGKASGNLETKYKVKELGLTFNQKWNTDNTLTTEVTMEDQLAKGLKLGLDTSFVPNTGKKSAKLKTGYKRDYMNVGCDIDFDLAGPTVHAAAVLGYEGWLAGYQMAFDTAKSKLAQNNFALGYKAGDFQLHTNVNDGTEFGGSIYQKVNDQLETAVNLAWTAGSNNTRFGIAAKYKLDKDASVSAKVNNASLVGVGYTQALRPGVKLTLSALIDAKNFNAGGHKVGMGFELEV